MATRLQKKLAKAIVEDAINAHPATGQELLEKVGYSEHLAKQSGRVLNSPGVKEELAILGFSVNEADDVVATILHGEKVKDENKLKAAQEIYKRLGAYAAEKTINTNLNINSSPAEIDKFKKIREKFENELLDEIAK